MDASGGHRRTLTALAAQLYTAASGRTVGNMLADGASRHPGRELLTYEDGDGYATSYSWQQVHHRSTALAAHLSGLGVRAGDRVHVHLPNRPEFLFTWFAAARLGALIVPTNTASSDHEIAYILGHARAEATVTDAEGLLIVEAARARAGAAGPLVVCERDELLALPATTHDPAPVLPETPLAVLYTSGTTSRPKGVIVTHANYLYAGEVIACNLRVRPEDRVLTVLPLFHANAQYYTTMASLVSGATCVLLSRFSASRFVEQATHHRATIASLFAAAIRMILTHEPKADWRAHQLRAVLFAQNLSPQEVQAWNERIGAPLLQLYGMTETIGPPLINPLSSERRVDSIGRVSVGYTCQVLRDDGTPAAVGEPGQLLVGGLPSVSLMGGYLDDQHATEDTLADGWLRTGDVVRVDHDGFFYFVDRAKDMIKRAGENVAASEVEAVLRAHPAVADAAVVGRPDPIRDEEIVAFVVPRNPDIDLDEVMRFCTERLAKFRVPGAIMLRAELPRTAVGKVQKGVLRSEALKSTIEAS